jgi:hypothetical protein
MMAGSPTGSEDKKEDSMSINEPINIDEVPVPAALPVDRREETVVTQQPGYEETEQVVHDIAAERWLNFVQAQRTVWTILTVMEVFIGLRFFLKWIAANPSSGFAAALYWLTDLVLWPFAGLVGNPTNGDSIFEVTTLLAMLIYALLFWVALRVIRLTAYRPSAITVKRSVHEDKTNGTTSDQTIYTTEPSAAAKDGYNSTTTMHEL